MLHTHTNTLHHHKNNVSEFLCELLEATGLLQVTAVMMRGSEMYSKHKHPHVDAVRLTSFR